MPGPIDNQSLRLWQLISQVQALNTCLDRAAPYSVKEEAPGWLKTTVVDTFLEIRELAPDTEYFRHLANVTGGLATIDGVTSTIRTLFDARLVLGMAEAAARDSVASQPSGEFGQAVAAMTKQANTTNFRKENDDTWPR